MEKQPGEQAAMEPADSGAEGGSPQVAGDQAARPEDRLTLLLRSSPLAGIQPGVVAESPALCSQGPKGFEF